MSQPWSVPEGSHVVVRLRVHKVSNGRRTMKRHGRFGFLHVVTHEHALALVNSGQANCGLTRGQLERIVG